MTAQIKPLVLIIDDDAAFSASLAETFEREGLRTSAAFFAEEGYSKAVHERPDMVILDINLQYEGDALQLLPRLQQATEASIVVLTGRPSVRQDLEGGGDGRRHTLLQQGRRASRFSAERLCAQPAWRASARSPMRRFVWDP